MRHIAIIGAGPSGLYLADQLLRAAPDVEIDVLERLPTPLGLVRYGVAPDHQSTKGVSRLFDRILSRDRVHYFGNVTVGSDIDLPTLLDLYDAVVLATGASRDRRLGIPGEDLKGVYGSGAFIGWYNNHPTTRPVQLANVRNAIVVGAGNVAIDVARVLAKTAAEFAGSDLAPDIEVHLAHQPLERITILARGSAKGSRFSELELAELGEISRTRAAVFDPDGLAGEGPVLEVLRGLSLPKTAAPVALDFRFGLTPVEAIGAGHISGLRVRGRSGVISEIPADLMVTCIGYETEPCSTAALDKGVFVNDAGRVGERLYAVGWCKRGPTGTIPTNRAEAAEVAHKIAGEVLDGGRRGGQGLRALLANNGVRLVDYAAWRRIDEDEVARAPQDRARQKHASLHEMLQAAAEPDQA